MSTISRICLVVLIASSTCVASGPRFTQRWIDLLYYEKTDTGYISAADSPEFFVTTNGKTNPQQEYDASLQLTRDQDLGFRQRFPLRYKHIASENQIPYQPAVSTSSSIASVIVAFPNRFMGNPASMFGHLFIVLESTHGLAGSDIVHFLAETDGTDPNAYIYNGLMGGFKGRFLVEPYHKKIKDYYDVEDREVLYHTLTLTPDQLDTLQLHLIELQQTFFYYYFLDENCAYFTGKFLNIVTEQPILTKSALLFPSQVINSLNRLGLLQDVWHRRPSSAQFNEAWNTLTESQKQDVLSLYTTDQETVPTHDQTLRSFLIMSDYMINNAPDLAQATRHNRILAYQTRGVTASRQLHLDSTKTFPIPPIVSNRIGWQGTSRGQVEVHYDPICYGEVDRVQSLEQKSVNYLGTNIVFSDSRPLIGYIELARVENIPAWTPIRPEMSWRINSQLGIREFGFTNQSFELGQSQSLGTQSLATAMAGIDISNFDPLLKREWHDLIIRPSLSFQLRHQVLPNTLTGAVKYEYRYGDSRYIGSLEYAVFGFLTSIQAVHANAVDTYRASVDLFF